jgi:ABC-type sugar transport system ATPase subunit
MFPRLTSPHPARPLRSGIALLVVSSDLPEVLALAHRIVVMSEGRVAGELDASAATEVRILELAAPTSIHSELGAA